MPDGIVVTRLFADSHCVGARPDAFRSLLARVARKLTRKSRRAPVAVEIYHGAEDLETIAGSSVVEIAFPSNELALELLKANSGALVIRLRLLPSDEESDSPFVAFYEKASLELAGKPGPVRRVERSAPQVAAGWVARYYELPAPADPD